ncbi:MAG: hypothetical protein K0A92_05830 [Methyloprofundus sp.]|nr:hypothetical protein [Methyloprofundus sp.]
MSKKTRIKQHILNYNPVADTATYEITNAPILDQRFRNLPQAIQDEFNTLSEQAENNGAAVIPRLLEFVATYPLPLIYSCLAIAYGRVDPKKQKLIIAENYQKNPKNIFARCNYARLCLAENNADEIPKIFDHQFDLKSLYPKRNQFHITEYTAFTSVFCQYYAAKNQPEKAEELFTSMQSIAPESSETQQVKELLHPTFLQRLSKKLFN